MVLNMPNGGLPVDDYLYYNGSFKKMYDLHVVLIELLKNGILPMNEKNIYHCDIKDANILVDTTSKSNEIKTRLIDWGLSCQYIPFKNNTFKYGDHISYSIYSFEQEESLKEVGGSYFLSNYELFFDCLSHVNEKPVSK